MNFVIKNFLYSSLLTIFTTANSATISSENKFEKNLFSKWISKENVTFDLSTCNEYFQDTETTIHCELKFDSLKVSCTTPLVMTGTESNGVYLVDPGHFEKDGAYTGSSCVLNYLGFDGIYSKTEDTLTINPNIHIFTERPPNRVLVFK